MPDTRIFPTCYFKLSVPDYSTIGLFMKCDGIEFSFDVLEYAEGGNHETVHHLPGALKYPHLVFTRGLTDQGKLREWAWKTRNEPELKVVTLEFMDSTKTTLQTWTFNDAFPVRWSGPSFAADASAVAQETLEVAHGGMAGL